MAADFFHLNMDSVFYRRVTSLGPWIFASNCLFFVWAIRKLPQTGLSLLTHSCGIS